MPRPRRSIVPLDAEATDTHTAAETAPPLSLVPSESEPVVETEAPSRTPARQKVADAIATVATIEADIVETSTAISKAERDLTAARAALSDAEDALERAKPRPATSFAKQREPWTFRSEEEVEAYHAKLNEPPIPIEDARAAVAKATDARDSAEASRQFHKKRLDQLSGQIQWRRSDIGEAARLAVHFDPAMAALAAETKRLVTQAAAAVRAFDLATNGALLQSDHPYCGSTQPTDYRVDYQGWALLHRWREALEQIRRDPDAVLPMPASE